jgi:hypothetical protein
VNPVAAYTAGLKTDSGADAFRSRTEAELASLKGVGGSMNPVNAYSAGLNRSITDSSRPGMESENSMTIDAATDTVDVVGDNNAESLRSRTEARLAALKEEVLSDEHARQETSDSFRSRTEAELAAAEGANRAV